jgi:DNA-binding PadR family transcriptional regulator
MQLRQEFEASTGEAWPLNVGQVYATLQRLDRDGLVEASSDAADDCGPGQMFRITTDGLAELQGWLRTPPDVTAPPRDELLIKVLVALRIADVDVAEVVQVHRRQVVELMQQYTRLKEDLPDADVALGIVVDAELFRLDGLIRWLDAADGRIKRLGPLPPMTPAPEMSAPERLRSRIGARS